MRNGKKILIIIVKSESASMKRNSCFWKPVHACKHGFLFLWFFLFFFILSNSFCILYHVIVIYEKIKHFSEESRYCSKNSLIQCASWTISNFEILSTLQNVWLVKKVGLKHHSPTVIQLHEGLKIVLQFKWIRHGTQHHLYSWGAIFVKCHFF